MSRSGRRPKNARPAAARPATAGARRPAGVPPVPLEQGRARGVLAGLLGFVGGFAVGAVENLVVGDAGLGWLIGISVGLAGVGLTGFFLSRGTVPRPEEAIWKPDGLRPWLTSAGVPVVPVMVLFYVLLAVGLVGNFFYPVFFQR